MELFGTYGGNTISYSVDLAMLNIVLSENLQVYALQVGDYLLDSLGMLIEKHPIIGDMRGEGLFLGVELVRNRETLEPAGEEAAYVGNRMRERGILIGTDGPYHNVLKIRPPMPFNNHDANNWLSALGEILEDDFN